VEKKFGEVFIFRKDKKKITHYPELGLHLPKCRNCSQVQYFTLDIFPLTLC